MKKFFLIFILLIFMINPCFATEKNKINVLFTIDNKYPIYTLLAINSILINNISNSDYTFYIIENNLTDKNKALMKNFVNKRKQKIEFITIDEKLINESRVYNHESCSHISSIAMARLFSGDLLPKHLDRVLYLDADIFVREDLSELYNADLEDKIAGMIIDTGEKPNRRGLYNFTKGYFNSGVIVLDLNKMREEHSSKEFMDYYYKNIEKFVYNKKTRKPVFKYVDQDLISLVWEGKIKPLNDRWNQQQDVVYPKGIIHFVGKHKPWIFLYGAVPHIKDYYNCWHNTPELFGYRLIESVQLFYFMLKEDIKYYI